jgi:ABC-type Mn2+/Zn2+ transport system ATPase subunit
VAAILIELRGATVHRGRQRVLGPLDLRIPEGSFVGVVGANGAGKTMLLRALAGLTHLSNGERRIDRNVLASRGSIGYLSQGEAGARLMPFSSA